MYRSLYRLFLKGVLKELLIVEKGLCVIGQCSEREALTTFLI